MIDYIRRYQCLVSNLYPLLSEATEFGSMKLLKRRKKQVESNLQVEKAKR